MVRIILRTALVPKLRVCRYRAVRIWENMLYQTPRAAVYGIEANIIEVELDVEATKSGEGHFHTVGCRTPPSARRDSGRPEAFWASA